MVDLELFKKHVRADDFDDDDTYLQHLLDTAKETVITATNRSVREIMELNGGTFPAQLKQAALMLAAHWYNQRESVATVQMHRVPEAFDSLVKPFTRLVP